MANYDFIYNERLGIGLPHLYKAWDELSDLERIEIVTRWEQIRGTIPERIKQLEMVIQHRQARLNEEANFVASCAINSEIAELASCINDLHIWFRMNQDVESGKMHS